MNKDTLILKDGTVIELEAGASLSDIRVLSNNRAAMMEVWGRLTENNLSTVTVKNGDGLTVGTYTGLVLENETSVVMEDGSVLTSFNLREKTDVEKRLGTLEQGQQIQDAGIVELAETISDMIAGKEE